MTRGILVWVALSGGYCTFVSACGEQRRTFRPAPAPVTGGGARRGALPRSTQRPTSQMVDYGYDEYDGEDDLSEDGEDDGFDSFTVPGDAEAD